MGYWRSKVLPTMKKLLEKFPSKKTASGEGCKIFDDSKEAINKEIEEKKTELGPKVIETYEAASAEVKALVRKPNEADLKKHSAHVHKFLQDLVKIEFPGSKVASEVSSNLGVTGPVTFIFEKICLFLPAEEKPREIEEVVVKPEEPAKEEEIKSEETIAEKDKEIVEEKKKEEVVTPPAPAPTPSPAPASATAPAVAGEEKKPVVEEVKKEAEAVPAVTAVKTLETSTVKAPETTTIKTPETSTVKAPETTTVKTPETSTVETPVKAPVTSAAGPPKA